MAVTEARTTADLPLKGPVRSVEVNDDNAALARFERADQCVDARPDPAVHE